MRVRCGGYDDDEVETLETEEEQVPDFVFYNSGISANENIDDSIGQDQSEPDSASTAVFEREHIRLRGFLEYLALNDDDYPLYVFDDSFDIRRKGRAMLNDYRIPPFIPASLHRIFPEKEKPPYRWFLLGPARSGTNVHIDPLGAYRRSC